MGFKKPSDFQEFREAVLDDVASGVMTPLQAEELAVQQGQRPFAHQPDVASYQISNLAIWSLEMTVAWLIWRDEAKVVPFFKSFRDDWITWQFNGAVSGKLKSVEPFPPPRPIPTFTLNKCKPATLKDVERESRSPVAKDGHGQQSKLLLDFASALDELTDFLADGKLASHAVLCETNRSLAIPSHEWRYLKLRTVRHASCAYLRPEPQPIYDRITFKRTEVVSTWGARPHVKPAQKAPVGRPPIYDADKIKRLAKDIIDKEGGWDPVNVPQFNNAEICRRLYELMTDNNWKRQPSESTLKLYVAEAIEEFSNRENEKSP